MTQLITQVSLFIVGIYLMNLLPPEEFGVLSMVTVFSGVLAVFRDFGVNASLIQKTQINKADKDTVFWMSFSLSILLASLLFSFSFFIDDFYNERRLTRIAQVLSFNFILQGLSDINATLLKKDFKFKFLFYMRGSSIFLSSLIAVLMAFKGYGIWALVAQTLVNTFIFSVLGFVFNDYKPGLDFKFKKVKEHISFGLPVFGTKMTTYASINADKLLIGKFIDAYSLGIYSRAYTLVTLPIHHFTQVLTTVMFSSFSLIKEDMRKIDRQQQTITRVLLVIITPFLGIIVLAAEPIIILLVGEKWLLSVPILKILAISVFFRVSMTLRSNVLWSLGRSNYEFYFTIISSIIVLLSQVFAIQFGITGMAYGLVMATMVSVIFSLLFVARALNTSYLVQLKVLARPVAYFIIPLIIANQLMILYNEFHGLLSYLLMYSGIIWLFERKLISYVLSLLINSK